MVKSIVMSLEAKWLEALKLPLKVMIGLALSSGLLLLLDRFGALDLQVFGPVVRPLIIVLLVVSLVFSLVGIGEMLFAPLRERQKQSLLSRRRAIRRREQENQRANIEARTIAHLDHLSREEIAYVADCLRKGSPSFYTYVHSPPVSMLISKGLAWTPSGEHHQDHYPFSFHDFVWRELQERKEEFIAADEEHTRAEKAAKDAELRRRH